MTQQTLTEVRGDLVLAALCIGQFRAPCQIEADLLLVQASEPLVQALSALGLELSAVRRPFTPAPMFAPEETILEQMTRGGARRLVHTHVSRQHDDDSAEEDLSAASNA